MREAEKTIQDLYNEITQDKEKWCYFSGSYPEYTDQDLFSNTNALKFIKSVFRNGGKELALDIIDDGKFPMTKYRSNHTLSAYLLGLAIRDNLHIDMKELPKLSSKPTKNFMYFWSLTCLYHDFAFALEEKSPEYRKHISSIDDFLTYFNIEYSLLEEDEDKDLIRQYYQYVSDKLLKIDHGIAAAMLLYNALMKAYKEAAAAKGIYKSESFVHNDMHYSSEYKEHIKLIAITIAKHNMWRANINNIDVYRQYRLDILIPNEEKMHMVSIDDNGVNDKNKLLFLLGLVDTLEPIKCLGRGHNQNSIQNPYLILKKLKIKFDYSDMKIMITCPEQYIQDYLKSVSGITDWMNLELSTRQNQITIKILKRYALKTKVA